MATGCADLKKLGHLKNGFYTVMSLSKKKLLKIYCDFTKETAAAETLIGYNNVKTGTGVYFYVMKSSSHGDTNTVINYERELLNIGRHMNMATGVFTAPTDGLYLFHAKGR